MDAIIYTSNSGFTAQYAKLLGERLGLPVTALTDAERRPEKGAEAIYLGWLMAGKVMGYKKARRLYRIKAVCGVGMGAGGSQLDEVRKVNRIPKDAALFVLQGGFDITKLHGIYRFMMGTMRATAGKKLAEKPDRTAQETDMLELLLHGGSRVCAENLLPVINWYEETNKGI